MLNFAGNLNLEDPLLSVRQAGWSLYEKLGIIDTKLKAFQYLKQKIEIPQAAPQKELQIEPQVGLVFVDGFFEETLSKVPSPLVALPLDLAIRSYGLFLQNRNRQLLEEEKDPLAALNLALHGRGAFLYVPPKCKAALHLTHFIRTDELASGRIHIFMGREAELELIQKSDGEGFTNHWIDFALDVGAKVFFQDDSTTKFQSVRATLKKDSSLKALFQGPSLGRSLKVQLTQVGSEVELLGLSDLKSLEESHIHACVEHLAPHTRSRQHFKSVLKDESCFSFEGKIYVHPEAQKTEGYQLNNNLILSDLASANAKPNLEIFADDVKASHGATFGQLKPEEIFYLRSRGLSFEEARHLLIQGFCKEILDHAR